MKNGKIMSVIIVIFIMAILDFTFTKFIFQGAIVINFAKSDIEKVKVIYNSKTNKTTILMDSKRGAALSKTAEKKGNIAEVELNRSPLTIIQDGYAVMVEGKVSIVIIKKNF